MASCCGVGEKISSFFDKYQTVDDFKSLSTNTRFIGAAAIIAGLAFALWGLVALAGGSTGTGLGMTAVGLAAFYIGYNVYTMGTNLRRVLDYPKCIKKEGEINVDSVLFRKELGEGTKWLFKLVVDTFGDKVQQNFQNALNNPAAAAAQADVKEEAEKR